MMALAVTIDAFIAPLWVLCAKAASFTSKAAALKSDAGAIAVKVSRAAVRAFAGSAALRHSRGRHAD